MAGAAARAQRRQVLAAGLVAMLMAALAVTCLAWWMQVPGGAPAQAVPAALAAAQFVGGQACAPCHQAQHQAWKGSHHELALQAATRASVLAPFRGERFAQAGMDAVFSQRDGRFFIHTAGADGRTQDHQVVHTIGHTPLQQYLMAMPDGGLQVFTVAWDSRERAKGGQRWFSLHGQQRIAPGDELHWSGRQNNASFMCIECHTTQFKKNFNAELRRYQSSWAEGHVACEACHGPGSHHLAWAARPDEPVASGTAKGLVIALHERVDVKWTLDETGNAVRSRAPTAQRQEAVLCARCHSHRSQISDAYEHGRPLLDTHVPTLLEEPLFRSDGQMKAEVYNDAPFQQSRMYRKGVTCSDCHDPHTLQLRAPGNQVCAPCHAPRTYDNPTHHFHPLGSAGARCVSCHMPPRTYMAIDLRHDHGIRVPRPDLTAATGSPDACTQCHTDEGRAWAARWANRWYPRLPLRQAPWGAALGALERGDEVALSLLFKLVHDVDQSPMVRASALSRAAPALNPQRLGPVQALLNDADPLVRRTAVEALAGAPPAQRAEWLRPLLGDPVKGVRLSVARWLAGVPVAAWDDQERARLAVLLDEYVAVQRFNADRPEAYNNLGTLYADQRQWPQAEAALREAIDIAPDLAASALNLANVVQAQGREAEAQALIRDVIRKHAGDAAAHHALGLSLLRQHQTASALRALAQAEKLEPSNARYAYVHGLARYCQRRPGPDCSRQYALQAAAGPRH